jgi:hypothetical protein
MSSDERHELDKNDLADFLLNTWDRIRPYLGYVALGLLVVAVGSVAATFMNQAARAKMQEGWGVLAAATTPDSLSQVMADYPNTTLAHLAQVRLGWIRFNEGKDRLVDDRGEAIRLLTESVENFEAILGSSASESTKVQAYLGVALAKECQSMVEEAKKGYQEIIDRFPTDPVAEIARRRLDGLTPESAGTFYTSFKNYQPPAPSTDLPTKIDPGVVPSPPEIPAGIDTSSPITVPPPPSDITSPGLPTIEGSLPASTEPTAPPAESPPAPSPAPAEPAAPPAPDASGTKPTP